ncbi:MAG: SIR2 family NAD-dependent protein deacylase [bacterium]
MATPRFANFERIVFFTGAGLSAESGIPTYRGQGGVWHQYDYRQYACQPAFERDPEQVWDFHDVRRTAVGKCEPNAGHRIIAEVQGKQPATAIVTQNIDGLHARAGGRDVVELHGSLWRVRCDGERTVRADMSIPIASRKCACGAYLRPDIVWFGDMLDQAVMARAIAALESADLIVSIGTSGVVYPAAQLPEIAVRGGATSVEINLEDTAVSDMFQHRLRGPASEMLAEMNR